jgi:hypothetical protein
MPPFSYTAVTLPDTAARVEDSTAGRNERETLSADVGGRRSLQAGEL